MIKLNRKNKIYWITFVDSGGSVTTLGTSTRSLRKAKLDLQKWKREAQEW